MAELEGKVAVLTGGASGMGEATVRLFVEGGRARRHCRHAARAGRSSGWRAGAAATFVTLRGRQEDQVKMAVDTAVGRFGGSTASSTMRASAARSARSRTFGRTSST